MNTVGFVNALKNRHNITSDYGISKLLQVTPQTVSQWRHNQNGIGDETALRVSELLELPYEYVLLCVVAERTKFPNAKKTLRRLARKVLRQHQQKHK